MSKPVCASVCLCVCLSVGPTGYLRNPTRNLYETFLCMLPMFVARSSSGTLMIGRIAYWREGRDQSAHRGRSVIYDCLVMVAYVIGQTIYIFILFLSSSFFFFLA